MFAEIRGGIEVLCTLFSRSCISRRPNTAVLFKKKGREVIDADVVMGEVQTFKI